MRRALPILLAAMLAGPAVAQAPLTSGALSAPTLDEDAPAAAFLRAARQSLAAGRLAEAMEALERAESRALTRDERPSRAGDPSPQALVARIAAARAALAGGDRQSTLGLIDVALKDAE